MERDQVIHRLPDGQHYIVAWPVGGSLEALTPAGGAITAETAEALAGAGARTYTTRRAARRAADALPITFENPTHYVCEGITRGWCGRYHRSLTAAARCIEADRRACTELWQIPDRRIIAIEPAPDST